MKRVNPTENKRVSDALDDVFRRYREMTYEERAAYWDMLRRVVQLEPEHPAAGRNVLSFPSGI